MAQTLKVGVIGVGGIARTHMPGWQASEDAEVVAGSDIAPEVLDTWGNQYGIGNLSAKPDVIFSDPEIDIVDICTPNMYHTELVVAALDAGKHVLCEKPLAPTPSDIQQMIASARSLWENVDDSTTFPFPGFVAGHETGTGYRDTRRNLPRAKLDVAPRIAAGPGRIYLQAKQRGWAVH